MDVATKRTRDSAIHSTSSAINQRHIQTVTSSGFTQHIGLIPGAIHTIIIQCQLFTFIIIHRQVIIDHGHRIHTGRVHIQDQAIDPILDRVV